MKVFVLVVFTILFTLPFQKSMAQQVQKPAVLNHIAVYVADLEKATAFYKGVFNLEQITEPFKDGRHTWFTLGPAGQLHLIQGAKENGKHDKNEHLCFSVADLSDFIKKLDSKNIHYEDWPGKASSITLRVDGIKQIYFQDPDGHWLEVNDDH